MNNLVLVNHMKYLLKYCMHQNKCAAVCQINLNSCLGNKLENTFKECIKSTGPQFSEQINKKYLINVLLIQHLQLVRKTFKVKKNCSFLISPTFPELFLFVSSILDELIAV